MFSHSFTFLARCIPVLPANKISVKIVTHDRLLETKKLYCFSLVLVFQNCSNGWNLPKRRDRIPDFLILLRQKYLNV